MKHLVNQQYGYINLLRERVRVEVGTTQPPTQYCMR